MIAAVLTFLIMLALDFVWADYTRAVQDHNKLRAAQTAAVIALFAALNTLAYVENHWLILSTMAGAFAGTWLSIDGRVHDLAARAWRLVQRSAFAWRNYIAGLALYELNRRGK